VHYWYLRVFVAYGGKVSEKIADQVRTHLERLGFEAFMAPAKSSPGKWREEVDDALKKADIFLVVYATRSSATQELMKEIFLAEDWKLTIESFVEKKINRKSKTFPKLLRLGRRELFQVKPTWQVSKAREEAESA
jgi:TIR domain